MQKISLHEFYFESPLYKKIYMSELDFSRDELTSWEVDWYSAMNEIDTTYKIHTKHMYNGTYREEDREWFYAIKLCCKRKSNDILHFIIYENDDEIIKIWQYISLADIQFSEIGKKYDKILEEDYLKDFKKAIWLAAHWTWAWSLVYLRRIFENLIFNTFNENIEILEIKIEDFNKLRMSEKVNVLQDYLPTQLVEMKIIYWILSKGVHELSEEECLKYFNPLKLSIELILDQRIEIEQKKNKDQKIKDELAKITQEIW